jgi:hypothetical protein
MTEIPPPPPNNQPETSLATAASSNKVRNIILAVIAVFVAFGVIGSFASDEETNTNKPADTVVDTTRAPAPAPSDEDLFIDQLLSENGSAYWVNTMGEPFMINFGYTICQAINEGTTQEEFVQIAMGEGFTDFESLGYIAGSAIRFFCPENEWWIYQ